MRDTNDTARRAYRVVYNIVKACNTINAEIWKDVASMFPDEQITPSGPSQQQVDPNVFLPWSGVEPPMQMPHPFEYHEGGHGPYPMRPG